MNKFNPILKYLNTSWGIYEIKGIYVEPRYWMAIALIVLAFLLLFTLARLRYLYVHWSFGKQSISMVFWGFILALIVEGFFLVFGKTLFTEILGWRSAPKPISTIMDIGRNKFVDVLGKSDEYKKPTVTEVVNKFLDLNDDQAQEAKKFICR